MADKDEKQSFSTQELLSMNMDRLKGYMEKWALDDKMGPTDRRRRKERKSQRLLAAKPGREVLVLFRDPIRLSKLNNANDELKPTRRFQLSLNTSMNSAVEKLIESNFKALIVDGASEKAGASGVEVSGLDFLMILKGVAPSDDKGFLLRKQAFLKELMPGESNSEKLVDYKMLKKDCTDLPMIYVSQSLESPDSITASRIPNVKSMLVKNGQTEGLLPLLMRALL
jgi:hypothetical protein